MQSIHGRQTRAREGIERPAANGEADAVIEAGNLTLNPFFPRGKGDRIKRERGDEPGAVLDPQNPHLPAAMRPASSPVK
jgi:hypothetical protein